ncbi:MAG TPA: hypothetical protein VN939_01015, partial [Chthoniobacterales bacterium]|nr:hypothetical protein [Chthoniobacterales bacterium]
MPLPAVGYWLLAIGYSRSAALPLLWQHEIADNSAEVVTAGDELSQGTPSGTKRIESFYRKPIFSKGSPKIDEFF